MANAVSSRRPAGCVRRELASAVWHDMPPRNSLYAVSRQALG